jgi:CBS domain-containing protein
MATVAEVMNRDVLAVDPTASIGEAAEKMMDAGVGAVVVMEDMVRLVGIVTERDILRAVATGAIGGSVGDAMTHGPDTIGPDESAGHAAALMIHGGFRHLPVVDGGDVVGMLSIRDLVRVSVDDEAPRGV